MKLKLNRSYRTPPGAYRATTKAQEITVDLAETPIAKAVAEAALKQIAAGIRAVDEKTPSGRRRWNRTGKLANGLRVEQVGNEFHIRPPDDRLNFEGALEQLAEDVGRPIERPLEEPPVKKAIQDATEKMVEVKKGPV